MERIHMNLYREIVYRLRAGESERGITRSLGLSRPTVHKYRLQAELEGYLDDERELPGSEEILHSLGPAPEPPKMVSTVEGYRVQVEKYLKEGLKMTAMYQRLRDDHGYRGSYSAIKRFVRHLDPIEEETHVRVHTGPGDVIQIDFGYVGRIYDPKSQRTRKAYVFVATLGYSRHQYAEIVFDQKIGTWLGLHQRAFAFLGGVPRKVVLDNLKSAVIQTLLRDPVLGEAYRRLAQHYRFLIDPNPPASPWLKGKVESGVGYVKGNFFAGQEFLDLDSANKRLAAWVMDTAGVRDHGTTHVAPLKSFREEEQAALQPLPEEEFTLHEIRIAKVHSDCHIVVGESYYSVPYLLVGKQVEVHVLEKMIMIYYDHQLVRAHLRAQTRGQWQTVMSDYPPEKVQYLLQTPEYCCQAAQSIGPQTYEVASRMLAERPLDRLRSVQGILGLAKSVGPDRLEAACARALAVDDLRYHRIKGILNAALDRDPLPGENSVRSRQQPHAFSRNPAEFFDMVEERVQ